MQNATLAEAERLLGISEKLLQNRDLMGSREFAILAQETEPLLEGSDQILAIVDVLIASEKRINNNLDCYSILQIDSRSDDLDLIRKQYRRLALLLHPDKNRFYFADHAFKLVSDAWNVLSDPIRKGNYDKDLSFFSRVDLSVPGWVQQDQLPVHRTGPGPVGTGPRKSAAADENVHRRNETFWTTCPYCFRLYEFLKGYEGLCLKCPNCERSFHGVNVPALPPLVPGEEAYYCCWGVFPMGFVLGSNDFDEKEAEVVAEHVSEVPVSVQANSSLPNWMPAPVPVENGVNNVMQAKKVVTRAASVSRGVSNGVGSGSGPKKRGRPRKYF